MATRNLTYADDRAIDTFSLGKRLTEEVLLPLKNAFVGKDEIVDLMGVCLVAGENLFLLGPPGTAKSALVRELAMRLDGQVFDYLLTRFTEPNELFGPFDIRRLREGELVTNTEGMLPEASFVLLDELLNAYRLAADAHATSGDLLSAARILENKMEMADQAVEALQAGWPSSKQAARCLQSLFELLARMGRHDIARERVIELRDERYTPAQTQVAAAMMATTATTYPSDEVRALAADSCRVVVGRSLPTAEASHQRQLLQSLEQLAQKDRLLQRDCNRFGLRKASPVVPRVATTRQSRHAEPTLVGEFLLPKGIKWQTVAAANDLFYAAGYQGERLAVLRGDWSGSTQFPDQPSWPLHLASSTTSGGIILVPPGGNSGPLWVCYEPIGNVMPLVFSSSDRFSDGQRVAALPRTGNAILAVARGPSGAVWVFSTEGDGPILATHGTDGLLTRTVALSASLLEGWDWTRRPDRYHKGHWGTALGRRADIARETVRRFHALGNRSRLSVAVMRLNEPLVATRSRSMQSESCAQSSIERLVRSDLNFCDSFCTHEEGNGCCDSAKYGPNTPRAFVNRCPVARIGRGLHCVGVCSGGVVSEDSR